MKKIDWEVFIKSDTYQGLSDDLKRILTNLYLEGSLHDEESLYDFIELLEGKITSEEFKKRALERATKK
jgi:hypothetical protein